MKNIGGRSRFLGFIDECGDHSMERIDKDFPLFVLAMVVIERGIYVKRLIPAIAEFKLRYWNHEGINLHSRDIRKALGPFSLLLNRQVRNGFLNSITTIVRETPFTLFISGIRKDEHAEGYGRQAADPYDLALEFSMEHVAHFLEGEGETELPIVAEARGRREDNALERVFYKIMSNGTDARAADVFKNLSCPLVFRNKRDNVAGIQIADLCAHPCARKILKPSQENRAYEAISSHLYERGEISGWKVFP